MTIKMKGKKPYKFTGEVKKLHQILELIKSMDYDEQYRTMHYLWMRWNDQKTISDVQLCKK